jgi:hypothetical protein
MTEDTAKELICCKYNVIDVAKIMDETKSVLNTTKSACPIKSRK